MTARIQKGAPLILAATLCMTAGCATPTAPQRHPMRRPAHCIERHGLPDARCTPGATRKDVSLSTICSFGYSRAARPPEAYTEPLKLAQIRAYQLPGAPGGYEEDHLVPLSIGGAPRDPRNLWPEPRTGPYNAAQKDRLETWAARMACARRIPLAELQDRMAKNWISLYREAGGASGLATDPPGG